MSHALANERLSAYLDGELEEAAMREVEVDLQRDPALRAELRLLQGVAQLVRDQGTERAPQGFHQAVMARVEAEHPQPSRWWRWLRRPFGLPVEGLWVALAAAAVWMLSLRGRVPDLAEAPEPTWGEYEAPPLEPSEPAAVKLPTKAVAAVKEQAVDPVDPVVPKVAAKEASQGPREEVKVEKKALNLPGTAEDGALRTAPVGYTLNTSDPAVLRSLLALTGRFGGDLMDASGAALTSAELTGSAQVLELRIPAASLTDFEAALRELGTVESSFDPDKLFAGSTLSLQLSVRLTPGRPVDKMKR